jgi:hypothetical protein
MATSTLNNVTNVSFMSWKWKLDFPLWALLIGIWLFSSWCIHLWNGWHRWMWRNIPRLGTKNVALLTNFHFSSKTQNVQEQLETSRNLTIRWRACLANIRLSASERPLWRHRSPMVYRVRHIWALTRGVVISLPGCHQHQATRARAISHFLVLSGCVNTTFMITLEANRFKLLIP